jgi:D-alanyl-D-alanine carboxypeptidase
MSDNFKKLFSIETRTKYFIPVLTFLFLVSFLILSLLLIGENALNKKRIPPPVPNIFAEVNLEAKSAIVWDVVNEKVLFSKNPDMPLPLASLTKVMTAVTTDGKLDDNSPVKITKEDLAPEGDSNLVVGDTWKARDLRDFTLLTSSNDGALALAAVAEAKIVNNFLVQPLNRSIDLKAEFIKKMNETASKIGLKNSKFFNEHGLDREADKGGAYGSAKDMATLFEYTLKNYPEILEPTRYKNLKFTSEEKTYSAENTNILVDKIPNLVASKTGYTDLAGGNLVIAFDAGLNRPIIVSVLGSTEQGRFSDVQKLVDASLKYISQ